MVLFYFGSWTSKLLTFETSTKCSLSFKGAPGVSGERGDQGKPGRTVSLWSSDGERFTGSTQMLGALHHAKENGTVASIWKRIFRRKWSVSLSSDDGDGNKNGKKAIEKKRAGGGSLAEWLKRRTCNSEAPLTSSWICFLWPRVQILGHACK